MKRFYYKLWLIFVKIAMWPSLPIFWQKRSKDNTNSVRSRIGWLWYDLFLNLSYFFAKRMK